MKDLLIVGGGPAGLSAGVYAARRELDIVLVSDNIGGHLLETEKIENYLGFESISGMDLAKKFENHLKNYDIELIDDGKVEELTEFKEGVVAKLESGKKIKAKTSIVASGSRRKKLGVPGEKQLKNKGVTYCAICDGPLFQDQSVAVIGGGNSGIKSALYLSKIAKKVYVIEFLDSLRGEKMVIDELKNKDNIEIITGAKTTEILGDEEVSGIKYVNRDSKEEKEIDVEGVAIEIGMNPNSQFVDVEKEGNGKIKVNDKMGASSERIFAAGDVNNKGQDQIAVAVGQGCTAALEAEEVINKS